MHRSSRIIHCLSYMYIAFFVHYILSYNVYESQLISSNFLIISTGSFFYIFYHLFTSFKRMRLLKSILILMTNVISARKIDYLFFSNISFQVCTPFANIWRRVLCIVQMHGFFSLCFPTQVSCVITFVGSWCNDGAILLLGGYLTLQIKGRGNSSFENV